ncbi:MAG: hypothetical protein HY744_05855 [Deltaproteobacteria bacterium]|nr:hypothetical protein [Deltaproteobacteria bacterium]
MRRAASFLAAMAAAGLVVGACGDDESPAKDGTTAGADAGTDAGGDAGVDAGDDAGTDAGDDAGPKQNAFTNAANWSAFDASNIGGLMTRGYFGGVFDGRYVHYVPCRTADFHGVALRYDTKAEFKTAASWESFDAGSTDGLSTIGYAGGVFDGKFVYFVPFTDGKVPHARVLRVDTTQPFTSAASWRAYDAGNTGGMDTTRYDGAAFDGRYVYFAPFGYEPVAHGKVLRYDTKAEFKSPASWSAYDAASTDALQTKGYYGALFDGRYVYFVSFHDGSAFHGRMLRYDTKADFQSAASWSAYDAQKTDGMSTVGYKGAAFDGRYVYYAPFRDNTDRHGRILRYDTKGDFRTAASWTAQDAGATDGLDTKGYVGAEFDGRYVYFVPYSGDENIFHGRALRYDTQGDFHAAQSWTGYDAGSTDGLDTKGYKFSAFDGRFVYYVPYNNGAKFHGIALRFDTKGAP